jgi:septal ring factor EnvC (AmiA/AmiB activator)
MEYTMKTIYLHSLLLSAGGILGQRFLTFPVFGRNPGIFQELQLIKRIREWSTFIVFVALLLAFQPYLVSRVSAQEKTADTEKIERLEQLIRAQQQQLELLQQQVNELKQTDADAQTEAKEAKSVAEDIESRVDLSATAKTADEPAPDDKVVRSGGGERMKLSINGFVNRMVNVVDDGKKPSSNVNKRSNRKSRRMAINSKALLGAEDFLVWYITSGDCLQPIEEAFQGLLLCGKGALTLFTY